MSVKVMGAVFDADLPRDQKFILLAYADHADHDGGNIYPSIPRIAWKTGYSERQVQRITRDLLNRGILVYEGESNLGTNTFRIVLHLLPARDDYKSQSRGRPKNDVTMSPISDNGDNLTLFSINDSIENGDKLIENGDILTENGDTAMSPESSFNRPINPSGIWKEISNQLQYFASPSVYNSWIAPCRGVGWEGDTFTVQVHNSYAVTYLTERIKSSADRLLKAISHNDQASIKFVTGE